MSLTYEVWDEATQESHTYATLDLAIVAALRIPGAELYLTDPHMSTEYDLSDLLQFCRTAALKQRLSTHHSVGQAEALNWS